MSKKKNPYIELAVSLTVFCIALFMMIVSFQPQKAIVTVGNGIKSMTIPRIVLSIMVILELIELVRITVSLVRNKEVKEKSEKCSSWKEFATKNENTLKILATLALMVLYTIGWNTIGFTLSTLIIVVVETKLVNKTIPLKKILLFALIFIVIVHVIFTFLFKMDFPEPILELIRGY